MSGRGGYAGRRKQSVRIEQNGGKVTYVEKTVIDSIKEATGASEEDITFTLAECNGDVNEATEKLIESPFTVVVNKKQRNRQNRQDDRKRSDQRGGRANSGNRGAESGTSRPPRQNRGDARPGGRGDSGSGSNYRGDRPRAGPRQGALRAANRQRNPVQEERKAQEARAARAEHEKENDIAEVDPLANGSEPAVSGVPHPVTPALPVKTGYAAALIGRRQNTPAQSGVPAQQPRSLPPSMAPPVQRPSAQPPMPSAVSKPAPPPVADIPPPVAEDPPAPVQESAVEPPEELETVPETTAASQPDHVASVQPIADSWVDGGLDAQLSQIPQPNFGVTEEDLSVQIKGPNLSDLEAANEQFHADSLPAYPAPNVDLSLEAPPSFAPASMLKFGSFAGVEEFRGETKQAGGLPEDLHIADNSGHDFLKGAVEVRQLVPELSVDTVIETSIEGMVDEPASLSDVDAALQVSSSVGIDNDPELEQQDSRGEPQQADALTLDAYGQTNACEELSADNKTDAATQVVQDPEPKVPEPSYTSTGVQHSSYSIPSPAVSVTAQNPMQEYKVDEGFQSAAAAQYGEVQEQSSQEQPKEAQYGVEDHVAPPQQQTASYEPAQAPAPTMPAYQHHQQQQPPHHQQHHHHHQHHHHAAEQQAKQASPPQGPPAQQRYVGQATANTQTDGNSAMTANQQPSATNASPSTAALTVPMVPPVRPHAHQLPFANHTMMPNPGMPFHAAHPYYPQYMQYQHGMYPAGMYGGTYGYNAGAFSHGGESAGYPAHVPPGAAPPKFVAPPFNPPGGVGGSNVNQGYNTNYPGTGLYTIGNSAYDISGTSGYANKDKDSSYLQPVQHSGYPGVAQQVPRNDLYYGVHGQGYSQGFRNQYHQHGYTGQYGGAGYGAPPHNFHND